MIGTGKRCLLLPMSLINPNSEGILPLRPFFDTQNSFSRDSSPSSLGISPTKSLSKRRA